MASSEANKEKLSLPSASVAFAIELPRFPGRLLLVKKKNGLWSLPSGRIAPGESVSEALFRELLEETKIPSDNVFASDREISVITVSDKVKSRIGIIVPAYYHGPDLSLNGWPVDDPDGDVVWAEFADFFRIASIAENNLIGRPEFNIHPFESFLVKQLQKAYGSGTSVEVYEKMMGWIYRLAKTNPAIIWDPGYHEYKGGYIYRLPLLVSLSPLPKD